MANARPEIVSVIVLGTTSLPLAAVAERRSNHSGIARIQHFFKWGGAELWRHWKARAHNLKRTHARMSSQ